MAKTRLRPKRKKYYHKAKKDWLFDGKSRPLVIIGAIILSVVALLGLVGAIMRYYRLLSK